MNSVKIPYYLDKERGKRKIKGIREDNQIISYKEGRTMRIVINTEKEEWVPHSTVKNVLVKPLVTKKEFGKDSPSILLVKIPKGAIVPEHIHEESEDILYILSGHAKMFVEGIKEFEIKRGMLIRVPRGIKHSIYEVTEDLLVYDVFSPGTI